MAVGARPVQVLRLVLGRVMMLLAAGSALGITLAMAAGRVLASIVYQASPRDPLALAAVLGAILLSRTALVLGPGAARPGHRAGDSAAP